MKTMIIFFFTFMAFQVHDTPDDIGTRNVNNDYFWNNDRNARALRSKSTALRETIKIIVQVSQWRFY